MDRARSRGWCTRFLLGPAVALCVAFLSGCSNPTFPVVHDAGLVGFEARLDTIRVNLLIPGMAAAIVLDGEIVWSRGFGRADIKGDKAAEPTTSFHLASLTKTFATTIVMQLVEEGVLTLDDPVDSYGVNLSAAGPILVRHLLTHTSESNPGTQFRYNGNRFGELGKVIEGASGRTFGELLVERILKPLALQHTAPNVKDRDNFDLTGLDPDAFLANMATGYEVEGSEVTEKSYPSLFDPAGGLIGSVEDMARYSIAIDQGRFLEPETWDQIFTPARSASGAELPYGFGWFLQVHEGTLLQWHHGWWIANSSLIVRAPERGLALIVAANTDRLSSAYQLGGDGNVMRSDVARLFVESFVLGDNDLPSPKRNTALRATSYEPRATSHERSSVLDRLRSQRGGPAGLGSGVVGGTFRPPR